MCPVTSTVTYSESIIACQSVRISAVSFLRFVLSITANWRLEGKKECPSMVRWKERDILKPILVDKGENISNHCMVDILSSAAVTRMH